MREIKGCGLIILIALCIAWPFWYCTLPVVAVISVVYVCCKVKDMSAIWKKVSTTCGALIGIGALCACVCIWSWLMPIIIVLCYVGYVCIIKPSEAKRLNDIMEAEGKRRKAQVVTEAVAAEEAMQAKWIQKEDEWREWKKEKDRFIESWFASADVILDTNIWMETAQETGWIEWVPRPGITDGYASMMYKKMGLSETKIDMSKMMPAIKIDKHNIDKWPYLGKYDPKLDHSIDGGGNVRKFGQRKYRSGQEVYWEVEKWSFSGFWYHKVRTNPGGTLLEILASSACGNAKVVVPGKQLDELVNITHKNPYKSPSWAAAQEAINKILGLQKMGRIDMPDVKAQPDQWAYLDAMLVNFVAKIKQDSSASRPIKIVSFDRDLIIRLRAVAAKCEQGAIEIIDKDDLIHLLT